MSLYKGSCVLKGSRAAVYAGPVSHQRVRVAPRHTSTSQTSFLARQAWFVVWWNLWRGLEKNTHCVDTSCVASPCDAALTDLYRDATPCTSNVNWAFESSHWKTLLFSCKRHLGFSLMKDFLIFCFPGRELLVASHKVSLLL